MISKDEFLKIVSPMFDASAHYNGTGSRTFTVSETADFFDKAYTLFQEHNTKVDATQLTYALLHHHGKHKSFQDMAAAIAKQL